MNRKENLHLALEAVSKGVSVKKPAEQYSIPRSTLTYHKKNNHENILRGASPILTLEEEQLLAEWTKECVRKGFPAKKIDLQLSVREFLIAKKRPNPFKDNLPGDKWFRCFMKRHPNLTVRTTEEVSAASACVSETDIRGWFKEIENILTEEDAFDILSDPTRIFNADETGFHLCLKKDRVIAPVGCKNVYSVSANSSKENITVLFTFSASGTVCPPLVMYPFQRIPLEVAKHIPSTWGVGRSDNGWMTSEAFYEFIGNVFNTHLLKENIKRPVLFFIDGHRSHVTYDLSVLCKELKIILIALFPNATRILQPADVAAFRPIKGYWKTAVLEWRKRNPMNAIKKTEFTPILSEMLQQINLTDTLKNGFKATGLYPWNCDALDYSKCLGQINPPEAENVVVNKLSLTYDKFCSIVGDDKVKKFENLKKVVETEQNNEEFFTLFRLWESFQDDKSQDTSSTESTQHTSETATTDPEEEKNAEDPFQISSDETTASSELSASYEATASGPIERSQQIQEKNKTMGDVASLNKILHWPKKAKRKGKRKSERVPYVLASKRWADFYEKKEKEKQDEEKMKNDKKLEKETQKKESEEKKKLERERKKKAAEEKKLDRENKKREAEEKKKILAEKRNLKRHEEISTDEDAETVIVSKRRKRAI